MESKNIIETESLYFQDNYKCRHVLDTLNSINASDMELVTFEPDNEVNYPSMILPQVALQMERPSDLIIFSVTCFSQSNQSVEWISSNQEIDIPDQPSEQIISPQFSESEEQENSQYHIKQRNEGKGARKTSQGQKTKKIDKQKNIFPNIAKRTSKIMFQDCKKYTQKYFKSKKIDFGKFEATYKKLLNSNCSGLALSQFFTYKEKSLEKMSRKFVSLFEKYLRKRYMVLAMTKGKMENLETYISCKNRQLMYFSQYLNSQARV